MFPSSSGSRPTAVLQPLAALGLLLLLPIGSAAFSYDEALDGDIDSPIESPPVFSFDLGSNVVSGSRLDGDSRDFDIFVFVVPDGGQLDSIRLDYEITRLEGSWEFLVTTFFVSRYYPEGPPWYVRGERLGGSGHPILSDGSDPMFDPEGSPISIDLHASDHFAFFPRIGPSLYPIQSGMYVLDNGSGWRGSDSNLAAWNYTLTFSVVPVPEPGSACMIGVGLGALAAGRRGRGRGDPE
ncbi:MAG: PEP-CTERM sorting domain-containing protein [Myxococcota bacterium]